eukprot:403351646
MSNQQPNSSNISQQHQAMPQFSQPLITGIAAHQSNFMVPQQFQQSPFQQQSFFQQQQQQPLFHPFSANYSHGFQHNGTGSLIVNQYGQPQQDQQSNYQSSFANTIGSSIQQNTSPTHLTQDNSNLQSMNQSPPSSMSQQNSNISSSSSVQNPSQVDMHQNDISNAPLTLADLREIGSIYLEYYRNNSFCCQYRDGTITHLPDTDVTMDSLTIDVSQQLSPHIRELFSENHEVLKQVPGPQAPPYQLVGKVINQFSIQKHAVIDPPQASEEHKRDPRQSNVQQQNTQDRTNSSRGRKQGFQFHRCNDTCTIENCSVVRLASYRNVPLTGVEQIVTRSRSKVQGQMNNLGEQQQRNPFDRSNPVVPASIADNHIALGTTSNNAYPHFFSSEAQEARRFSNQRDSRFGQN